MNAPKLLTLAEYTAPDLIVPQLAAGTTTSVMREMAAVLRRHHSALPDQSTASGAALSRELLTSTSLGSHAVFPQLHLPELSKPQFVFGRACQPLPWLAQGFPSVDLIFLILIRSRTDMESEQLVGTLQNLNADRIEQLRNAKTVEGVQATLAEVRLLPLSELPRLPLMAPAPHARSQSGPVTYRRWRRA